MGDLALPANANSKATRRSRSPRRILGRYGTPLLVPLVILLLWEVYPRIAQVSPTVLPTPSTTLEALWSNRDIAWTHTIQTVKETVLGFLASLAFAIVVATLMDSMLWLRRGLYPMLVASQTVPIIAIAPLMIIWFGFGMLPKVLIVILVTFFPIVVALLDGFASTDEESTRLLRTMGASKRQIFLKLRLPTALPFFFTGLRIAVTYAVTAAIVAEYVGAQTGLGIWMLLAKQAFQTSLVFAAVLITAVVTAVLFAAIGVVARFVIPWYYAQRVARS